MTSIYNIHYLKHRKPELNDDDTYIYLVNEPVKNNKIDHILNSQYKTKNDGARVFRFRCRNSFIPVRLLSTQF